MIKFLDANNLQTLCHSCHSKHKQKLERLGKVEVVRTGLDGFPEGWDCTE